MKVLASAASWAWALSLAGLSSSAPQAAGNGGNGSNKPAMPVVKTTVTDKGQVLDWVPVGAQAAKIASPPPASVMRRAPSSRDAALVHAIKPKDPGPAGTVPILRAGGPTRPMKRPPPHGKPLKDKGEGEGKKTASKSAKPAKPTQTKKTTGSATSSQAAAVPTTSSSSSSSSSSAGNTTSPDARDLNALGARDTYSGQHWWASTGQPVDNHGGTATYNMFKAFVQSPLDFSLLQVAVLRSDAPNKSQTIEAGWINYPIQVADPHLFIFYTTNGYEKYGDNLCGWNRDVAGWVQYDQYIYPGVAFGPLSSVGGSMYEADIGFYYFQGNWWMSTLGRWIGYYPGSLFSQGGVDPTLTLSHHSNQINFYGEVYNSEVDLTTTDMGSGVFPESGFGRAAYMRKMYYYDLNNVAHPYDGSQRFYLSDSNRYRLSPTWNSGTDWGSYMFIGGPGAGGVTGG